MVDFVRLGLREVGACYAAFGERAHADFGDSGGQGDGLQAFTFVKRVVSNRGVALGYFDRGDAAAHKALFANAGDGLAGEGAGEDKLGIAADIRVELPCVVAVGVLKNAVVNGDDRRGGRGVSGEHCRGKRCGGEDGGKLFEYFHKNHPSDIENQVYYIIYYTHHVRQVKPACRG